MARLADGEDRIEDGIFGGERRVEVGKLIGAWVSGGFEGT